MLCSDLDEIRRTRLPRIVGDIAVLAWPGDADRAEKLGMEQVPRLLVVEHDGEPPAAWDQLTDWIRLPAEERDVEARLITLALRTRRRSRRRLERELRDPQ